MNIYEHCPVLACKNFSLRLVSDDDCNDLLQVYSDLNALPFFNSDNCNGDNFYYASKEQMASALSFWQTAYENNWFARLSIIDNRTMHAIGTAELCLRVSQDAFNEMGIIRVDVRSDYEREDSLFDIFSLLTPAAVKLLCCKGTVTKAPIYAIERIKAIRRAGFVKSEHFLIDSSGYTYDGYWTKTEHIKSC